MHWSQRKKTQLSAKSHFWKNQEKPQKMVIVENMDIFGVFSWFLQKWDFVESWGFLRYNQCIKTFHLKVVWHDILLFWKMLLINAYINLHYAVSKVWSQNFTQFAFMTLFAKNVLFFRLEVLIEHVFCQARGFNSTCSCRARSSPTRTCAIKTSSLTKTCAIKTSSPTKTCATRTSSPNNNTFFSRKVP